METKHKFEIGQKVIYDRIIPYFLLKIHLIKFFEKINLEIS